MTAIATPQNDWMAETRAVFALLPEQPSPVLLIDEEEILSQQRTWNAIGDLLRKWMRDPRAAIDDDYQAPTPLAIQRGLAWVGIWRDASSPTPTRMSPDGEGGVSFEWRRGQDFVEFLIEGSGLAELRVFSRCRLLRRVSYGQRS